MLFVSLYGIFSNNCRQVISHDFQNSAETWTPWNRNNTKTFTASKRSSLIKLASHVSLLYFQQCYSLYYLPVPKLCFLTITGKIMLQGYSNGFWYVSGSSLPMFSPLLVYSRTGWSHLPFSPALTLRLLQPQQFGDVHLCLLGGHCHLIFVLRALSWQHRTSVNPASLQNSSSGRCVLLSLEFCRGTLHSVVS